MARLHRLVLAGAGVVGLLCAALLALAAPANAAGPQVTVMPATGLSDGQTVTVSGSGWTPNTNQLMLVQCPTTGASQSACNIAGGKFFQTVDAQGNFSVKMTVTTRLAGADCTVVQCAIEVHEGTDPDPNSGKTANANISFGQLQQTSAAPSSSSAPVTEAGGATQPSTPASTSPSAGIAGVAVTPGAAPLPQGANAGGSSGGGSSTLTYLLAALAALLLGGGVLVEVRRVRAARAR